MIKLDVYRATGDADAALIVSHPTGIVYIAQAGGMACGHPECEGFAISLGSALDPFDDCSYGCEHIAFHPELQEKLAADLHEFLIEQTKNFTFQIGFDFNRIRELQEGWWPVNVTGTMDERHIDWKGYLHTGNCD